MGSLVVHDVMVILLSFLFIYALLFFVNLKDVCVNVVWGNAQVLDEELDLFGLVFLGWYSICY